jgi:hypothetical protein
VQYVSEAEAFHRLYYDSGMWTDSTWLSVSVPKCPLDLWIYQEMLFELQLDVIVQTGSPAGGSALFIASMCDLICCGKVVTTARARETAPATPARARGGSPRGRARRPRDERTQAFAEFPRRAVLGDESRDVAHTSSR